MFAVSGLALACADPDPGRPATPTATPTPSTPTPPATATPPADSEGGFDEAEANAYGMEYLAAFTAHMNAWDRASSGIERDPTHSVVRDWRDATVAWAEVEPHARAASCAHQLDDLLDDLLYDFALWLADAEVALLSGETLNTTRGERALGAMRDDVLPALVICGTVLRGGAERE